MSLTSAGCASAAAGPLPSEHGSESRRGAAWPDSSAWIPALLLVAVATLQIALARTADLSPWKGGGFGMFSTTDRTTARSLRVFVTAPGRAEELRLAPALADLAMRAAAFPSAGRLDRLAYRVGEHERIEGHPVTSVRVEVWRTEFEAGTLTARARRLRDFARAAGGDRD